MDGTGASMAAASTAFAKDVDLSTWEMATSCGSCHIGGSVVEFDRNGVRHSQRPLDYANFNADQNYVLELFDSVTGLPKHYNNPFNPAMGTSDGFGAAYAMWSMPGTYDNKFTLPDGSNAVVPSMFVNTANGFPADAMGWAPQAFIDMGMAVSGQMMMPNVREMDCFFCHLSGFNNIISSVAVQMGYLNAAPSLSSGLMNMFSQTYNPGTTVPTGAPVPAAFAAFGQPVKLSGSFLSRLNGEPLQENCRQCHTPTTMKNFSDMFDKFLAAAPMDYDPTAPGASLINGMVMPKYDLNAPFVAPGGSSPEVVFNYTTFTWENKGGGGSAAGPFGLFPMALDSSWAMDMNSDTVAGGANPGMSGPLYYAGDATNDQNANKKATIPFPRADFFKRGDIWDDSSQEIHYRFGCAGCHYNTNSTNADLNQCDPGRGRTRMGGVESAQTLGIQDDPINLPGNITVRKGIDTHDTVKRCQDCHVTGQNVEGISIDTFGAPNPTAAHTAAGLMSNLTNALRLDAAGNQESFTGNHLDVIDCSVCHIYKKAMTVRALDSTSGNRYPTLIGFPAEKGMMAMFSDPMDADSMDDATAIGAFTNSMMGMGYTSGAISGMLAQYAGMYGVSEGDIARMQLKNPAEVWKPIYGWHANTPKTVNGAVNPNWRMRLVPINFIVAQMWDDSNAAGDANGDNAESAGFPAGSIKWDPPISRDMKVGMNFGAGPFGTIPVGFGSGAYQSAYMPDFTFSGAFNWVGAYGGNIILSTPEEINAYKANRAATYDVAVPGRDRDYSGVELVFQGGNPFQVTHNVVATSVHVLGDKTASGDFGCGECHSAGSEFFSGDYDMTGTAVPASATYDVDGIDDADPTNMTNDIPSTMMFRPIVDYEVVADHDDLRTGSEAKDKATGAVLDVEFEEHGCWDAATQVFTPENGTTCTTTDFVKTTDLSRSKFMYPALAHDDATLATKISALEAIGTDVSEATIATTLGIGAAPVADIASINGVTATTAVVTVGDMTVVADTTGQAAGAQYSWTIYKDAVTIETATGAAPAAVSLTDAGTYRVELRVTSVDGVIATDLSYAVVTAEERNNALITFTGGVSPTGSSVTLVAPTTNVEGGVYDAVRVFWGDGDVEIFSVANGGLVDGDLDGYADEAAPVLNKAVNYTAAGDYTVSIQFYDTTVAPNYIVDRWAKDITLP